MLAWAGNQGYLGSYGSKCLSEGDCTRGQGLTFQGKKCGSDGIVSGVFVRGGSLVFVGKSLRSVRLKEMLV